MPLVWTIAGGAALLAIVLAAGVGRLIPNPDVHRQARRQVLRTLLRRRD
jgi:Tfp pilus assembly protein PilN